MLALTAVMFTSSVIVGATPDSVNDSLRVVSTGIARSLDRQGCIEVKTSAKPQTNNLPTTIGGAPIGAMMLFNWGNFTFCALKGCSAAAVVGIFAGPAGFAAGCTLSYATCAVSNVDWSDWF